MICVVGALVDHVAVVAASVFLIIIPWVSASATCGVVDFTSIIIVDYHVT